MVSHQTCPGLPRGHVCQMEGGSGWEGGGFVQKGKRNFPFAF